MKKIFSESLLETLTLQPNDLVIVWVPRGATAGEIHTAFEEVHQSVPDEVGVLVLPHGLYELAAVPEDVMHEIGWVRRTGAEA